MEEVKDELEQALDLLIENGQIMNYGRGNIDECGNLNKTSITHNSELLKIQFPNGQSIWLGSFSPNGNSCIVLANNKVKS
jgi:hypothetical protein